MLKQQARLFTNLAVTLDLIAITAAFVAAHALNQCVVGNLGELHEYSWVLLVILPVWIFLITYSGLYSSMRTKPVSWIAARMIKVHAMGGITVTSCIYLLAPREFSRPLVASFIILSLLLLILVKAGVKLVLNHFRRKGYNVRHILIVGSPGVRLSAFVDLVRHHADWGLIISGIVRVGDHADGECRSTYPELGPIEELIGICKNNLIDEVVFSLPRENLHLVDDYLFALQEMGVTVRMVIDLYDAPTSRIELAVFHEDVPMLTFYSKAFDSWQLFLKRCLDIVGAVTGLVITALLFPVIAVAIRLESKGPLFFGQERVGENGRIFKCWKFRSMYADAEERKQALMAQNEMQGAMFKMKNDPRVTRVGKFIRKTSIDELPQFWNVLCGEMSLVGTRPPTPDEVAAYENWHRKRICIKPGITGLWQVSGRNQVQDFDDVVRLDIRYIEEWSLWLDIRILMKTIAVVFAGRGAS